MKTFIFIIAAAVLTPQLSFANPESNFWRTLEPKKEIVKAETKEEKNCVAEQNCEQKQKCC